MSNFKRVIKYIENNFEKMSVQQLASELTDLKIKFLEVKDINLYAFYVMNKAIRVFENEENLCLKVALAVYAILCNSNHCVRMHIGYLQINCQIVPHCWITIDGKIIDLNSDKHIDMLII